MEGDRELFLMTTIEGDRETLVLVDYHRGRQRDLTLSWSSIGYYTIEYYTLVLMTTIDFN